MASCDVQTLLNSAACFDCLSDGEKKTLKLQLLCEIANGAGDSGITQLTGDVTAGPGSGSQPATIAHRAVTVAKFQAIATASILGRTTAGSGDVEILTAAQARSVIGAVNLAGDTMTGPLSFSGTTNPGLRLSNLTTTERDAIVSPAAGMAIWNTTLTRLNLYNGSAWTNGYVKIDGDTMTGPLVNSTNGALSTPAVSITGTPITGGSATTTKPLVLIEPFGTTSTGWSTSGTMLGVNAHNAFTGNLIDAQLNGVSKFSVTTAQMLAPDGTAAAPGISWGSDPDTGFSKESGNRIAVSIGGTIRYYFDTVRIQNLSGSAANPSYAFSADNITGMYLGGAATALSFSVNGAKVAQFGTGDAFALGASSDTILVRDGAANTLALRNGATAQSFRVYNTYTDSSNYERGVFDWSSTANALSIGTQKAGTGTNRAINILIGGTASWQYSTSGHYLAFTDNAFDIGASGANRPRNLYLAGGVTHGSATLLTTTTALTNGAAAQVATLTNGPTAGNPTKWIPINDNGTTRYIPAW